MQLNINYCEMCRKRRGDDENILSELARSENKTIMDWLKNFRSGEESGFKQIVMDSVKERMEEEADKYGGMSPGGDLRENFSWKVLPKDIEHSLEGFMENRDILLEEGRIKITHKGARKMANQISLKLVNFDREKSGVHKVKDTGYGLDISHYSRTYEFGDSFQNIDIQKTLENSLKRSLPMNDDRSISLAPEDFQIFDRTYEARMCIGLIIDESSSMGEDKRSVAIDTCLALGKLKKTNDILKVFIYAAEVKEVPYWDILNVSLPGGTTDMKTALQFSRKAFRKEKGIKQIYLITDAEPNTEAGEYVGFEKAIPGIKREAINCRKENITLNIVMLTNAPRLKEFAGHLARINAGRVFFISPSNMVESIAQDYIATRKKAEVSTFSDRLL